MLSKDELISIFVDMHSAIRRQEEAGQPINANLASQFYIVCVILDSDVPVEYMLSVEKFIRNYRFDNKEA